MIRNVVHRILAHFGRRLVHLDDPRAGERYLHKCYRDRGIDLVLDVGANTGQTGVDFRRNGYRGRIVSFEPQGGVFEQLSLAAQGDTKWECRREGLGRRDEVVEMMISGYSPSSSVLPIGQKHVEVWPQSAPIGRELIAIRSLDSLAHELKLGDHKVLLKMDVQGYEREVLAGATLALPKIQMAFVELLFAPLYDNQSPYYEVMTVLESAGLRFVGLYGAAPDPESGYLLYADGLFVRDPS